MQLLNLCSTPSVEFASVSILLKGNGDGECSAGMGNPFLVASPFASVAQDEALSSIKELHDHLTSILESSYTILDGFAVDVMKEHAMQVEKHQIFRPCSGTGIGLHYRIFQRETHNLAGLLSLLLPATKGQLAVPIWGVVLCAGIAGDVLGTSPLAPDSLLQRMDDFSNLTMKIRPHDRSGLKSFLSTMLIVDEELRKTNETAKIESSIDGQDNPDEKGGTTMMNMKGIRRMSAIGAGAKGNVDEGAPFKEEAIVVELGEGSAKASKRVLEQLRVLSVSDNDTILRRFDSKAQDRKMNLDPAGGNKSRFRRKRSEARDPDFDGFDYQGPKKAVLNTDSTNATILSQDKTTRRLSIAQPKKDSKSKPLAAPRGDAGPTRRMSNLMSPTSTSGWNESNAGENDAFSKRGQPQIAQRQPQLPDSEVSGIGNGQLPHVQVNIALNEDLSCSYKQSQLSSCTIEGVVQIQVKTSARNGFPFYLMLKDLSAHVLSVKENEKFADDVSESLTSSPQDELVDRKYAVAVPRGDSYHPVLSYKCVPELRPVPIRVQTRVKRDVSHCRVALQISSNPNNEGNLTDLTIIMGVPEEIIGESLVTQPPGGVWNESKRSVIWVVSELGEGEKFQLQARFEVYEGNAHPGYDPQFPVLVRCQCLHAQLSDVELEVRDVPEVFPAEILAKLARRYRLSHRERA